MSDWEALAKELKFPGEKEMWDELYVKKGLSINTLANKFSTNASVIRRRLVGHVPLRGRGGPNAQRIEITEAVLESIRKIGVPATAKNLGCTPQTLYTAVYYKHKITVTELRKQAAAEVKEDDPPTT